MLSEDRRDRGPYHDEEAPWFWYQFGLGVTLALVIFFMIGATA